MQTLRALIEHILVANKKKGAEIDTIVVRCMIADDGVVVSIHDEPNVGFDTTGFDVSLICYESIAFFVRILIYKGFDAGVV